MEFLESMCSFANVFNKELAAELWSALLPYSFTLSVFLGFLIPPGLHVPLLPLLPLFLPFILQKSNLGPN